MDLDQLACGNCGATLKIPEGVEFVNCLHCGTSLKVRRTESVAFTEVLQTLQVQSDRIDKNTTALRLQNEIMLLDQEWEQRSAQLMIHGKHGRSSPPSKVGAIVMGTLLPAFGVFWIGQAAAIGAPSFMVGFGVVFVGGAFALAAVVFWKAIQYQQLQADHEQRRNALQQQLRSLR